MPTKKQFVQQGKSLLSSVFAHVYGHFHQRHGHMDMATFLFVTSCSCFVLCSLSSVVITEMVSWFLLSLWSCEIVCLQLKLLTVKCKKVKTLNMWTFLKSWAVWRQCLLLLLNHSFRQVLFFVWPLGWFSICLMSEPEKCVFYAHLLVIIQQTVA